MQEEYADKKYGLWELINTDPAAAMAQIEKSLNRPGVQAVRVAAWNNRISSRVSAQEARKKRRKTAKASRRRNRGK